MRDIVKSHYKNFGKFGIVGVVNTVLDFSVFYILYDLYDVWYLEAQILAFLIALSNSFVMNSLWTFKKLKRDQLITQIIKFAVVGVIGLGLSLIVLYVANLFMWVYFAKVFAVAASFFWNYAASWLFVFKD